MILALDISTSITGYTVIDLNKKILFSSYVELSDIEDFVDKVEYAKTTIIDSCKQFNISSLSVEENLQSFRRGFSSANTINKLARFNGALSYAIASGLSIKLTNISVSNARSSVGIKILKSKQTTKTVKEQVLEQVKTLLEVDNQNINWPTRVVKSGPRKGTKVLEDGCFDMADSIVIGLATIKLKK